MEGRDIGTNVFPGAAWKFYLDASPEERARRRQKETEAPDTAQVGDSIRRRDETDSRRRVNPLTVAADAVVIDTTGLTIDGVVARVLDACGAG